MSRPPAPVAVVGPTASGKSALGLDLAERLGGEIVNVDSMQLYRGMDIGTAKVPPAERRGIPHHQLDVLEVTEIASVAAYQRAAAADVTAIRAAGRTPVLVGGSMMYVQALLDGWRFPPTDPAVRARWEAVQAEIGVPALHARLAEVDPAAAAVIEPRDPRRIVRALEVIELTGKPFAASRPGIGAAPRWGTRILGLGAEGAWLADRIARRTAAMFAGGLVEEVTALAAAGLREGATARRAIGYAQVLALLDGRLDRAGAEAETLRATRRYVRRQRSWFRRDPRIRWLDAAGADPLGEALAALGAAGARPGE